MYLIEEYILRPKDERQAHLKLDEPCIERGGQSMYLKGLLAHLQDTTIPKGHLAHVAHACHNGACSNPAHIYWATPSENAQDRMANGDKTIWEKMVAKYGETEARNMQTRKGNTNAEGGKGRRLTEEHKRKISEGVIRKYEEKI